MTYGMHRAKGAPLLGVLPGPDGPFGRRLSSAEDDGSALDIEEPAATVPAPRNGSER
ncbi:hypothetical protein ACFTXJ_00215 [Streptomyces zhihengii]|uniref:hypothetical protein n=1 Tax=Streptomyces zhihengii TaxID=1818004 RepID=UPI0036412585